ncbi:hypothetical protein QTO34_002103 [Cnephaeus nilssonii]|uniref:Bactericidal permeability-increasing protein n=1 Tax=Cnephaeus nilssonii TaxID=3371016 RepID=A0AA40HU71_CNENI|nr:hypothetical protein QTO34_002103 [Eptesicus nilssonii]
MRTNYLFLLLQSPLDFPIHLHTKSLGAVIPQLARLYPNTELELEISPESAPFLMFTPGNVTFMPVMNIQAFALLPNSSNRKPLFQLRARTNISATVSVSSGRVLGSLTPGSKLKLELKHSNIDFFNVRLLESIFNYYASYIIFPFLNAKLEKGFPLPLPRDTYLNGLELQIHKVSEKRGLVGSSKNAWEGCFRHQFSSGHPPTRAPPASTIGHPERNSDREALDRRVARGKLVPAAMQSATPSSAPPPPPPPAPSAGPMGPPAALLLGPAGGMGAGTHESLPPAPPASPIYIFLLISEMERDRNTDERKSLIGCLLHAPHWDLSLQPGHGPTLTRLKTEELLWLEEWTHHSATGPACPVEPQWL